VCAFFRRRASSLPLDRPCGCVPNRFVWGRDRLPKDAEWTQTFTLSLLTTAHEPDVSFPVAHTCFFSLDLPTYTSYDVLRAKLLYACVNCQVGPC
jgi:hypothetical protein